MTNQPLEEITDENQSQRAARNDLLGIVYIALGVLLVDFLTKAWAYQRLRNAFPIDIIPNVFRFAYGENTGIAFGLFQNQGTLIHVLAPMAFMILIYIRSEERR